MAIYVNLENIAGNYQIVIISWGFVTFVLLHIILLIALRKMKHFALNTGRDPCTWFWLDFPLHCLLTQLQLSPSLWGKQSFLFLNLAPDQCSIISFGGNKLRFYFWFKCFPTVLNILLPTWMSFIVKIHLIDLFPTGNSLQWLQVACKS
jgi:hypothetical protein